MRMALPETIFVAFQSSLINVRTRNIQLVLAGIVNNLSNYYMEVLSIARKKFEAFKDCSLSKKVNSIRF